MINITKDIEIKIFNFCHSNELKEKFKNFIKDNIGGTILSITQSESMDHYSNT